MIIESNWIKKASYILSVVTIAIIIFYFTDGNNCELCIFIGIWK